jgi:hypothetical protein
MKTRLLGAAAISLAAAAVFASSASAASATDAQVSSNWAGYAAGGSQFSKVSGTWVQPPASCDSGSGDAAFWVGIGGATGESNALEQTGTEVDCSNGSPVYSAWYELVPAAPVTIDLPVKPGDKMSATVGVNGDQVSISMTNQTTGKSFNKTLQMDNPDTSSAEWIAEAPSACGNFGRCRELSLTNFGAVKFSSASATTTDGHTGTISDPSWTADAISLDATQGNPFSRFGTNAGAAQATPSALSTTGAAFSVSWAAASTATPIPVPTPVPAPAPAPTVPSSGDAGASTALAL